MNTNPYANGAPLEPGHLVAVVTGHIAHVQQYGARAWMEFNLAEVVEVGENRRIEAVRFAGDWAVTRREDISGLIDMAPVPPEYIDVQAALKVAEARGEPFESFDDLRRAIRHCLKVNLVHMGIAAPDAPWLTGDPS